MPESRIGPRVDQIDEDRLHAEQVVARELGSVTRIDALGDHGDQAGFARCGVGVEAQHQVRDEPQRRRLRHGVRIDVGRRPAVRRNRHEDPRRRRRWWGWRRWRRRLKTEPPPGTAQEHAGVRGLGVDVVERQVQPTVAERIGLPGEGDRGAAGFDAAAGDDAGVVDVDRSRQGLPDLQSLVEDHVLREQVPTTLDVGGIRDDHRAPEQRDVVAAVGCEAVGEEEDPAVTLETVGPLEANAGRARRRADEHRHVAGLLERILIGAARPIEDDLIVRVGRHRERAPDRLHLDRLQRERIEERRRVEAPDVVAVGDPHRGLRHLLGSAVGATDGEYGHGQDQGKQRG